MSASLVTFLFEIPPDREAVVEKAVSELGWNVQDHAGDASRDEDVPPDESVVRNRCRSSRLGEFAHFFSMVIVPRLVDDRDSRACLLIELSADGARAESPSRLAHAIPDDLCAVLTALRDVPMTPETLGGCLRDHLAPMGSALFAQPGLHFVGTPGMTIERIRGEAYVSLRIRELLRESGLPQTALGKLQLVRQEIYRDPTLKWALFAEPMALKEPKRSIAVKGLLLAFAAFRDYLWVLLPLPALAFTLVTVIALLPIDFSASWSSLLSHTVDSLVIATSFATIVLIVEALLAVAVAAFAWRRLRQDEDADQPLDIEPDSQSMRTLLTHENIAGIVQNHMVNVSRMKPGRIRRWAVRLALWAVGELTKVNSHPGFLAQIGTIHFARWYLMPDNQRLVFLSNYDGSWQSYLEDFIARLHVGLSSIWSNTLDFPKTKNLVQGGASDGARFKRWSRRQQLPTPIWFSAYPHLTASSIRNNAVIRHGLASASTEADAAVWLSSLGYQPPSALEKDDIPTLVFGGLSSLCFSRAIILNLADGRRSRRWLRNWQSSVSYGEHGGHDTALVIALTASGLQKLGLPEEALRSFPTAFQQGMSDPVRSRLLGDHPRDERDGIRWGLDGQTVDVFCMVYADSPQKLAALCDRISDSAGANDHPVVYRRDMAEVPIKVGTSGLKIPTYETFGFRDNLSQPVLRGIRDWAHPRNANHLVEPGEFVLGYPDNQSDDVPVPSWGGRPFGRNGTFLVVRHFAQERLAFERFLDEQASRLASHGALARLAPADAKEWIAAKMVGRWRSGAPLVRTPDRVNGPGTTDNDFLFGKEDPDGLRCPLGAHIRRANPRDSFDPGSKVQLEISNRHRILRVGRKLAPSDEDPEGMLFMCLCADIERQFEFLQQTWLNGANFGGVENEVDCLLGPGGPDQSFTVQNESGPLRLEPLASFVRTLGGGYFFIPSRTCLAALSEEPGS